MDLIIYGMGDFAALMQYYFESETDYKVVAFCGDKQYIKQSDFNGLPIVNFEDVDRLYPAEDHHMFIAIGYKNMRARKMIFDKVKNKNYVLASFISKKAHIDASNSIGENCIILQGSILEPFVKIESNTFINSGAIICHHSHIKKHCFVAAGSLIGGYSTIGNNSFIGFRATVAQKLEIADETLIAANSLCLSSTYQFGMYVGSPAKLINKHKEDGIRIVDDNQ